MKELAGLALTLVLLMGASGLSWNRSDQPSDGEVTIEGIRPAELQGLELVTTTQTISMTWRRIEAEEPFPWFTLTRGTERFTFTGDASAVGRLLDALSRLKAVRSLGEISPEEAKNIELDHPRRWLSLRSKERSRVFEIGRAGHQRSDLPLRLAGSSEVFLVRSETLQGLVDAPGPFMVRQLIIRPLEEVTEMVMAAGGRERRYLHINPHGKEDASWAAEETPDARATRFETYLGKLQALTLNEYADGVEIPPDDELLLRLSLREGGEEHAWVKLWRVGGVGSAESQYYAVSTTTRVPVQLTRGPAEDVARDLQLVLAGDDGS